MTYNIGDTVIVAEIKANGIVLAFFCGRNGLEYNVRYFSDGVPKTEYFFSNELSKGENNDSK